MTNEPSWQEKIAVILASGYSRREVYDQCGIAKSTFSELENGEITEPKGMSAVTLNDMFRLAIRRKK